MKGYLRSKKTWTIFLSVFAVVLVVGAVYASVRYGYSRTDISFESLIDNAKSIKDFHAEEGVITSLSDDPWIEYKNETPKVRTVTINVSSLSDDYMGSELFVMHKDKSMECYTRVFQVGENVIDLQLKDENIDVLRFDLLTEDNCSIGIENIVLNEPEVLSEALEKDYRYMALTAAEVVKNLFFPLFCICVALTWAKKGAGKGFKGALKPLCISLGVFAAVYAAFTAFSVNGIYKREELGFREFASDYGDAHDFRVEDESLISESVDPWVTFYDNNGNAVRAVTIDVDRLSADNTDAELFVFMESGIFDIIPFNIREGANTVILPEYSERISYFRFDLTDKAGIEMNIGRVVFNEPSYIKSVVWGEMAEGYIRLAACLLFMGVFIYGAYFGRRKGRAFKKPVAYLVPAVLFLLGFGASFAGFSALLPIGALTGFCMGKLTENKKANNALCVSGILVSSAFIYIAAALQGIHSFTLAKGGEDMLGCLLMYLGGALMTLCTTLVWNGSSESAKSYTKELIWGICEAVLVVLMTAVIEMITAVYFSSLPLKQIVLETLFDSTFLLSVVLLGAVYLCVRFLIGGFFGRFAGVLLYLCYFTGNYVKLKYHDSVLMPMDVLQLSDFLSIVNLYVPLWVLALAALLVMALICFLLYRFRKKIAIIKPHIPLAFAMLIVVVAMSDKIEANYFIDMGIDVTEDWRGTKDFVKNDGALAYSYIKFREVIEIFPKPDENYGAEYMGEMKKQFDSMDKGQISDTKPDVILIMEESMFDMGNVPDVKASLPLNTNLRLYSKGKVISPKYGGGTGSVEFEALTGMSNYFFLENVVPYVTYWNNDKREIPGIAKEFGSAGYQTTAVHPNSGAVYNREVVYKCMGFDSFLDKSAFNISEEDCTNDGYLKDDVLADFIIEKMKDAQKPEFMFAVTIENHTLYESKYKDTEVKLTSDKLSKEELHSLEQYSNGVLSADRFIGKMVDYVNSAERPTILYIWGDHLPSLAAFPTLGYTEDKYNKYTTPLIAYSNFKDINVGCEYITPNQLAPQILRDAEIEHSSYFDFIYSMRENYPVIQKEFGIPKDDETIKKYETVQYDLLFGNEYLLGGG